MSGTQGIILLAFGHQSYGKLSFNLALSIKYHNPNIKIQLVHDGKAISKLTARHLEYFDILTEIDPADLIGKNEDGNDIFCPGKAKTRVYKYLAFDHALYLDSDACAMKDLQGLMDACIEKGGHYYTQVVGTHTLAQGRDFKAMQWAWADDVWEHYELADDAVLPATNSSFAYIRKCNESAELFLLIRDNIDHGIPLSKLRRKWGGTFPDELALNVALAQTNTDASLPFTPVLFATRGGRTHTPAQIKEFYLIGMYGGVNFTHAALREQYDREIHKASMELMNVTQEFKFHYLVKDKHPNKR